MPVAGVGDPKPDPVLFVLGGQGDPAAGRGVLERVGEQVAEDVADPGRVRPDIGKVARDVEIQSHALVLGGPAERFEGVQRRSIWGETARNSIRAFPDSIRLMSRRLLRMAWRRSLSSRAVTRSSACFSVRLPILSSRRRWMAMRIEVSGVLS